jgi:hypothetical protein
LNSVRFWLVFVFAASSLAASCGETNIQAIERLRPLGGSFRARLAEIGRALPPPGQEREVAPGPGGFDPSLVLDFQRQVYTADALMEEQLSDPDRSDIELDLILSPQLLSCLSWTGPKNPLDRSVWDDRTELGPECEAAFRTRWLVVVRKLEVAIPERVRLHVFVVDLGSGAIAASFPIHLTGDYRRGDIGRGKFASEALRQLRSDAFVVARCELARKLATFPATRVDMRDPYSASDPCASQPRTFRVTAAPLEAARP